MKKADNFFSNTISWCFHLLFFVTPLIFTWFNEELFEFNKMLFVYSISLILGGLWIAQMALHRHFQWKKSIFDIPIALFVISQLLSTIFSIHPLTSVMGYYTRFHGGLLSTLAYSTIYIVFVQTVSPKRIWGFFKTLAISSIFVSLVAIPEHFGHSLSCVFINSSHLAETAPLSAVLSPSQLIQSYNAQCWVQDVQTRVFATFGQPNWLAAFAITLMPVFAILAAIREKKSDKWLYTISSLGLLLDLIFTRSRSGVLGLVIGGIWFAALAFFWIRTVKYKSKKEWIEKVNDILNKFKIFAGIVGVSLLFIILFGTPYTPSLLSLGQKAPETPVPTATVVNRLDEGGTSSTEIRKIVWTGAINVWKRYPIFGSGVETFAYSYYQDRPMAHNNVSEWDFLYNKAHNEFLNFLATTGLVGFLSYCTLLVFFIGWPVVTALKSKEMNPEKSAFLFSLSAGLVALTVSNTLGFSTVMVTVLLFFFPAVSWVLNEDQVKPLGEKVIEKVSSKVKTFLPDDELGFYELMWPCVVGLAVVVGLIFVWRSWRADYLLSHGKQLIQSQQYSAGVDSLTAAYEIGGNEGIFAEELSQTFSGLSAALVENNQATSAAYYKTAALQAADEMMADNPRNLNFYKTKTRVLATLAPQDPSLLKEAEDTLVQASKLAPTDPKIVFNLSLIRQSEGQNDQALADMEQVVSMKPNYEDARMNLATMYIERNELQKALDQYHYVLDKIQPANTTAQAAIKMIDATIATASAKTTKTAPPAKPAAVKKK